MLQYIYIHYIHLRLVGIKILKVIPINISLKSEIEYIDSALQGRQSINSHENKKFGLREATLRSTTGFSPKILAKL